MTETAVAGGTNLSLFPFHKDHAPVLVDWVRTADELHWLAPATEPPLTPSKVLDWRRPGGFAFLGTSPVHPSPLGYAELNPIGTQPDHFWLGHCIVNPESRGQGIGRAFVRALLNHAFHRLGAARVSLIVFPENEPAIRCYLAAGFVLKGEEWHSFCGGARERLLRLEARSCPQ